MASYKQNKSQIFTQGGRRFVRLPNRKTFPLVTYTAKELAGTNLPAGDYAVMKDGTKVHLARLMTRKGGQSGNARFPEPEGLSGRRWESASCMTYTEMVTPPAETAERKEPWIVNLAGNPYFLALDGRTLPVIDVGADNMPLGCPSLPPGKYVVSPEGEWVSLLVAGDYYDDRPGAKRKTREPIIIFTKQNIYAEFDGARYRAFQTPEGILIDVISRLTGIKYCVDADRLMRTPDLMPTGDIEQPRQALLREAIARTPEEIRKRQASYVAGIK